MILELASTGALREVTVGAPCEEPLSLVSITSADIADPDFLPWFVNSVLPQLDRFAPAPLNHSKGTTMGTKNNPGKFDALAKALPDEPTFTLIGRDPLAGSAVYLWAMARPSACGKNEAEKLEEARVCGLAMELYCAQVGREPVDLLDHLPVEVLAASLAKRGLIVQPVGADGLSYADYLMVCTIEEAAEVIQRGCKSLRFGALEVQPDQDKTNAQRLTAEMIDFRAATEMLREHTNYLDAPMLRKTPGMEAVAAKKAKIARFLGLSIAEGRLHADAPAVACATCGDRKEVPAEGAGQVIAGVKCPDTLPCPACCPSDVAQRFHAPVQPDTGKTEVFDDSPLARARRAVEHEESVESHASCRELLKALVKQIDGETLP